MIDLSLYRQASFRGIPFHVKSSQRRSNHRVDIKEYPFKNEALVVDMGLSSSRFELTAYVLGDDALARRRDLEEAFDKTGSGILVHPTRGEITVQVIDVRDDEDFTELGVADFVVSFVKAGTSQGPVASVDTSAAVISGSLAAETTVIDGYDLSLGTDEVEFTVVHDELVESFNQVSTLFQQGSDALRGNFAPTVTALDIPTISAGDELIGNGVEFSRAAFNQVKSTTASINSPLSIVRSLIGQLAPNSGALWNMINGQSQPYESLLARPQRDPANGLYSGGIRSGELNGHDSILAQMFFDATVIEAAKTSVDVNFETLDQAVTIRSAIGQALAEAVLATPSADPKMQTARRSALRTLRTSVFRDITERSTALPRLEPYTGEQTETARVLAYRLTGGMDNQNQIATRNGVSHPSFMPAVQPLLYLKGENNV